MNLSRRAFTLMELMIVVVILAILFAVTMPSMSGMASARQLKNSSRELRNVMRFARTEAIFSERTTNVFLDIDKKEFWFDPRRDDVASQTELPPGVESGEDRRERKETNRYSGKQFEGKKKLEQNVSFGDAVALENNILDKNVIAIDFYPDGSASPVLFSLVNVKGNQMTIEVVRSTGMIEVTAGSVEAKQEKSQEALPPPPGSMQEGGS